MSDEAAAGLGTGTAAGPATGPGIGALDGAAGPGGIGAPSAVQAPPGPRPDRGAGGGRSSRWAVSLVVAGGVSVQFGGALAVSLMPRVGPVGVVTLRLVVAALVLMVVCRPRVRGYARADWYTVIGFGIATGAMNHVFYQAAARIPLGIAVTLEVLGPLALSMIASRRLVSALWAALAVSGVFLLGGAGALGGGLGGLDMVGVVCALAAGAMWAGYILLSARTGRRFPQADGLALAMAVAAVLSLPLGIATAGERLLVPSTLGLGAAVAMLSSTLPYTLELIVLRRLHAATFAVLMSLEPALAALAGFLILSQSLSVLDALGMTLVIVASIGAVRTRVKRPRAPKAPERAPS